MWVLEVRSEDRATMGEWMTFSQDGHHTQEMATLPRKQALPICLNLSNAGLFQVNISTVSAYFNRYLNM